MGRNRRRPLEPQTPLERAELLSRLDDRLELLRASAERYDAGAMAEAPQIALHLRVLLHDSLLQKVGIRSHLLFTDSASVAPDNAVVHVGGLIGICLDVDDEGNVSGGIRANLDGSGVDKRAKFHQWWNADRPVFSADAHRYSRAFVVLQMANAEGAHVDHALDAGYSRLRTDSVGIVLGRTLIDGAVSSELLEGDVARGSVRQIAWELLNTLDRQRAVVDNARASIAA